MISTILKHLTEGLPQLNLSSKTKTPAVAFGVAEMEHEVIFCQGELLQVCNSIHCKGPPSIISFVIMAA